jgi:hypothetical protein
MRAPLDHVSASGFFPQSPDRGGALQQLDPAGGKTMRPLAIAAALASMLSPPRRYFNKFC